MEENEKIKMALDTNTVLNFSEFLDKYSNGNLSNINIQDMVDDKNNLIDDFTIFMRDFFRDPMIRSVFYKDNVSIFESNIYPNYYDINEMYVDMLQSGALKESQKDVVFQLMKDNYKQFRQHYPNLLTKYDKVTHEKIDNSKSLEEIGAMIVRGKRSYELMIKEINDLSTNTEIARLFKLGLGKNPKYEFVITSYVEKEIFTHVLNSIEYKVAQTELQRKAESSKGKRGKPDTIKVFNEETIRKILKHCSLVMFSKKASQRIENLGNKLAQEKIDKKSRKKIKGVDSTKNKFGDAGDPNCVAAAQCLGLAFVTSNLKDVRTSGFSISPQEYSQLAKQYKEEKTKIVPLAKDHTFAMLNPPPELNSTITSIFEKLLGHMDNSIQNNVQQTVAEETCTVGCEDRLDSAMYNPMEAVEHSDDNDIIEKDSLLGLEKPELSESNVHIVKDEEQVDEREYNRIYNTYDNNDDLSDDEKRKLAEQNITVVAQSINATEVVPNNITVSTNIPSMVSTNMPSGTGTNFDTTTPTTDGGMDMR